MSLSLYRDYSNVFIIDHPLVKVYLSQLRDKNTQKSRFQKVTRKLTSFLIDRVTENLIIENHTTVQTPLNINAPAYQLQGRIAIVPILRAALRMMDASEDLLPPDTPVWFYGAKRDEDTFRAKRYYEEHIPHSVPKDFQLIIIEDPMLATGGTVCDACTFFKERQADNLAFIGLIAAPEGIEHMQKHHPDVPIYVCAVDECLNDQAYIVPGLGDAGDRGFNTD